MAHTLKNSSVNQSISADTLRLKVGKANAASAASAGKASSSDLSGVGLPRAAPRATRTNHIGNATCRLAS